MAAVTQSVISRQLGISQRAVGYALSDSPRYHSKLRPETRQRVIEVANRLGYRPHRHAQLMRGKKSGVLGMIQFGGVSPFAGERAYHIAGAIQKVGYEIFSMDVAWYNKRVGAVCSAMLDAHVEGIILVSPTDWFPPSEVERLRAAQIPVVGLSGLVFPGVPQVRADVRQGMFDLTQHLVGLGHRRLSLVTMEASAAVGETHNWPKLDRIQGFREAVQATNDNCIEAEVICDECADYWTDPYRPGEEAVKKLLQRSPRPDAVLCTNDDWACGAFAACADAGLRVPDDMAITGFDNTLAGGYGSVRLTTVAQPLEAMAQRAVEILVKQIRDEKLSTGEMLVKMPCRLVVRQSCGAAKQTGVVAG